MWNAILTEIKAIVAKIEAEIQSAWNFLISYIKEAVTEEEAALFPLIEAQAAQLLQDEAKTTGLTVKQRVAMAEAEIMADLILDGKVASATLVAAYVAVTAHKLGLVDGNQGQSSVGDLSGNTTTAPITPTT